MAINILVCVKRVPVVGAKIPLTEDEQEINARHLKFAISPHEECAVEEALRQIEQHGGTSTILTLGPEAAVEQLRESLATGIDRAILLEIPENDWGPQATAHAIAEAVRAQQKAGTTFDLLLFGNESADAGNYQVAIRVAHALDLPCVTGIKALEIKDGTAIARHELDGGWEVYEVPLPAVITVKEGINLPRFPTMPGKLKAKKQEIPHLKPSPKEDGLEKLRLQEPDKGDKKSAEILGKGAEAAPRMAEILKELGLL